MNYWKMNRADKPISRFIDRLGKIPFFGPVIKHRFVKFGTVGFSGTLINLVVLYINQEMVFADIHPPDKRLHLSLSVAIFLATLNNYLWNRHWTWNDRKIRTLIGFFVQMAKYYSACAVAIGFQYLLTVLLSNFIHYLISNILSIILAAVITYVLNDIWTFAAKRRP
jgi:dolichol-phosphate mannosyltransferase